MGRYYTVGLPQLVCWKEPPADAAGNEVIENSKTEPNGKWGAITPKQWTEIGQKVQTAHILFNAALIIITYY